MTPGAKSERAVGLEIAIREYSEKFAEIKARIEAMRDQDDPLTLDYAIEALCQASDQSEQLGELTRVIGELVKLGVQKDDPLGAWLN